MGFLDFLERPTVTKVYDLFEEEPDQVRFYIVRELERVFDYNPQSATELEESLPYRTGRLWTYFASPNAADSFIMHQRAMFLHRNHQLCVDDNYRLSGRGNKPDELIVITHGIKLIKTTPDKIPENLGGLLKEPRATQLYEAHKLAHILQQSL